MYGKSELRNFVPQYRTDLRQNIDYLNQQKQIKMMKNFTALALLAGFFGLMSCESDEIEFRAGVDAYTITKVEKYGNSQEGIQADTLYGLGLNVVANKPIQSATATSVYPGVDLSLKAFNDDLYNFYYETPSNAFSRIKPYSGEYNFEVISTSGEEESEDDELVSGNLIYPTESFEVSSTTETQVTLSWSKIEDADYIALYLYDGDKVVFATRITDLNEGSYTFKSGNTAGWVLGSTPQNGKSYTAQLHSYKHESDKSGSHAKAINQTAITMIWSE